MDYQQQLALVRPDYDDCPEPCVITGEDQSELCQQCDLNRQWNYFRESFDEGVERKFNGELEWSFDALYRDVRYIIRLNSDTGGKGYPTGCDALTAACLTIWREEDRKPDRMAAWALRSKLERQGQE